MNLNEVTGLNRHLRVECINEVNTWYAAFQSSLRINIAQLNSQKIERTWRIARFGDESHLLECIYSAYFGVIDKLVTPYWLRVNGKSNTSVANSKSRTDKRLVIRTFGRTGREKIDKLQINFNKKSYE